MTRITACPDAETLQRLAIGLLADDQAEPLEEHVEQCVSCLETLKGLQVWDTLLDALRAGQSTEVSALRAQGLDADALIHRLKALAVPVTRSETPEDAHPAVGALADAGADTAEALGFLEPPQQPDELGSLGAYGIVKMLGSGGMGIVFEARDTQLDRLVAVKVMRPGLASRASAHQRFLREARVAASIEHDHIVSIYQVGEHNGVAFLVMPLLKGESLEMRLRRESKLPVAEVLRIGREVAEGLSAAHKRGLIHRDIKPANLFLEEEHGRVKILDFGLARASEGGAALTQSGAVLGTPHYMAPEQALAETVDARCDLYSLGVVLYRLCTGWLPFRGNRTMAVLTALVTYAPMPVRDLNPALPPDLADLVMQLLSKEPAGRPSSAMEVERRLAAMEAELAVGPHTVARPEPAKGVLMAEAQRRPSKTPGVPRSRRRLLAAACLLLAMLPLAYFFGGTVIRIATNKGQIVVQVDDPKTEVTIKENGAVIQDRPGQREITLAAGDHELEVTIKDAAGETHFFTKKLTLSRGGKGILNLRQELAQAQPTNDKPAKTIEARPSGSGDADAERNAVKWVLSIGGQVKIRVGRNETWVEDAKALPAGEWLLAEIRLENNPQVNDVGLEHLNQLTNLTHLDLDGTRVSDAGLVHLKMLTNLTWLKLDDTHVTDAGLEHLKTLTNLTVLRLSGKHVSDAGLVDLKSLTNLTHLGLRGTQVSDAGLVHLKALTNLTQLELAGTDVSDAGLVHLKALTNLTCLNLTETRVTNAGLHHLNSLTYLSELYLVDTRVSDAGLEHLKRLTNLTYLSLVGTRVTDAGLVHLKTLTNLRQLYLRYTRVSDAGLVYLKALTNLAWLKLDDTSVTDAGLEHLKTLTNLRELDLSGTKVTADGVAALQKALPKCKIVKDGLVIEPSKK